MKTMKTDDQHATRWSVASANLHNKVMANETEIKPEKKKQKIFGQHEATV